MMRGRPTAVYRVLDEDDLLHGSAFLDDGPGEDEDATQGRSDPRRDRADRDIRLLGGRRRALVACAATLVAAALVARLVTVLLAGSGGSVRRAPVAVGAVRGPVAAPTVVVPLDAATAGSRQQAAGGAIRRFPQAAVRSTSGAAIRTVRLRHAESVPLAVGRHAAPAVAPAGRHEHPAPELARAPEFGFER